MNILTEHLCDEDELGRQLVIWVQNTLAGRIVQPEWTPNEFKRRFVANVIHFLKEHDA